VRPDALDALIDFFPHLSSKLIVEPLIMPIEPLASLPEKLVLLADLKDLRHECFHATEEKGRPRPPVAGPLSPFCTLRKFHWHGPSLYDATTPLLLAALPLR
jgi:hypothetical protein